MVFVIQKPYINPDIRIIKNTALIHHNMIDFPAVNLSPFKYIVIFDIFKGK